MPSAHLVALALSVVGLPDKQPPIPASQGTAYCRGEYADNILALAPGVREIEEAPYSYCVRSTATYECLSYGPDGNVRRQRSTTVTHGTAFGYRHQGGGTLLLTNNHVAEWPLV